MITRLTFENYVKIFISFIAYLNEQKVEIKKNSIKLSVKE